MARGTSNSKKNSSDRDIQILRQERVASLRARGMSLREIHAQLADPNSKAYVENPDTKKPFDQATIQRDLQRIRKRALDNAQKSTLDYLARQLTEIEEAKRSAWAARDLHVLARLLELEARLTGTLQNKLTHKVDDEQIARLGEFREALVGKLALMAGSGAADGDEPKD